MWMALAVFLLTWAAIIVGLFVFFWPLGILALLVLAPLAEALLNSSKQSAALDRKQPTHDIR